ncbi:MAG: F0F1 ATP synthase subunit B [Chromatiales bacterium]|jgi:F-type H+-transporting ATPase subunit b
MNINATLIGQSITFFVFVWFVMKFVWPPIMRALDARKAKIAEGLAAAERGRHEQQLAQERATELLHDAKQKAAEIVNQAQKRAGDIVEEAKDEARGEGERILISARSEIDQEANRVREGLREQVAKLAVMGAEKILQREVNAAAHKEVLDSLAKQL